MKNRESEGVGGGISQKGQCVLSCPALLPFEVWLSDSLMNALMNNFLGFGSAMLCFRAARF